MAAQGERIHLPETGEWCWCTRHNSPCRVLECQDVWGEVSYRVWLPAQDAVVRVRASELSALADIRLTLDQILHVAASAKLQDALEENLLLAPIQSTVIPLPHQVYALNRAMSRHRIRYLLADEVGLGKTIEAGLILRELKSRGMASRILVVAPKGLIRQWQAEMRLHFGETFQFIEPSELVAFRSWRGNEENLWQLHNQVICSLDSVKPLEARRGWSHEQVALYNRERFDDLIAAAWDLVIIDESHRLGGSSDQVARYKLGVALAEASPYLLLLSATPHQGKTDHFLRLMQLIDRESFPDEQSVTQDRVRPFVIRTEKRAAINAEGHPLFRLRITRLQAVAWQSRHAAQRQLYEAVTEYVRNGYNQAMAAQQRHIGFLMILMQRLVTSSTAAIRTTLEKRLAVLMEAATATQPATSLFENTDFDEWTDLDGQTQSDVAVQVRPDLAKALSQETGEVELLLNLARDTESDGSDAKAEVLLELIYRLQQEESDPQLKVLVFTEFVPTQEMLSGFLKSRGFSVCLLNGTMDIDTRTKAQQVFAADIRIMISTDAGGEGLNLQFCHVIVNFDMPWNPMRIEQRIGRVDRIGQSKVVRAINFVLEDTVEHRVRQVLEEKLEIIAHEFGVDKASDVMDSADAEIMFDELFVHGIQDPTTIERECDAVVSQVRERIADVKDTNALLADGHALDAGDARKWRDHPAQFWLERAITSGLPAMGGVATRILAGSANAWSLKWADGSESPHVCFDARTAEQNPELEWITLEDSRARIAISSMPIFVTGQPMPTVAIKGLPKSVAGVWSLWEVSLSGNNLQQKRFLPIFVANDGRAFVPTAKRIWDLLVTERVEFSNSYVTLEAAKWFEASYAAALNQGERLFSQLATTHNARLAEERERAQYAYNSRNQSISRLGLPAVRAFRLKRLDADYQTTLSTLADAEVFTPNLVPLTMIRISEAPHHRSDA